MNNNGKTEFQDVQYHDGSGELVIQPIHATMSQTAAVRVATMATDAARTLQGRVGLVDLAGTWITNPLNQPVPGLPGGITGSISCSDSRVTVDNPAILIGLLQSLITASGKFEHMPSPNENVLRIANPGPLVSGIAAQAQEVTIDNTEIRFDNKITFDGIDIESVTYKTGDMTTAIKFTQLVYTPSSNQAQASWTLTGTGESKFDFVGMKMIDDGKNQVPVSANCQGAIGYTAIGGVFPALNL